MFSLNIKVVMDFGNEVNESIPNDLINNIWYIEEIYENYIIKGQLAYKIKSIQNPLFNGYISRHSVLRLATNHEQYIGKAVRSLDKVRLLEQGIDSALKLIDHGETDLDKIKEILVKSRVF